MSGMKNNNKLIIFLFGAPGSGKTTIGKKLNEIIPKSIFISIGSVMRDDMNFKDPFLNVDRVLVMDFSYKKYLNSNSEILILDCNPYPDKMWKACMEKIKLFEKAIFIKINAPDFQLLERMHSRNRIDSDTFTFEQRLNYYYKNINPKIKKVLNNKNSFSYNNIDINDVQKIINLIKQEI